MDAAWDDCAWLGVGIHRRTYVPGARPGRVGPKRASELGGASEINDPSFMFNLFES